MIECAYDAVGCAYLIGLQVALEACNFGKLKSLIFPVSCCMGAEYADIPMLTIHQFTFCHSPYICICIVIICHNNDELYMLKL